MTLYDMIEQCEKDLDRYSYKDIEHYPLKEIVQAHQIALSVMRCIYRGGYTFKDGIEILQSTRTIGGDKSYLVTLNFYIVELTKLLEVNRYGKKY